MITILALASVLVLTTPHLPENQQAAGWSTTDADRQALVDWAFSIDVDAQLSETKDSLDRMDQDLRRIELRLNGVDQ